ncbi:MAG: EAL domain-containing protein [Pseudomonadota bacterium]
MPFLQELTATPRQRRQAIAAQFQLAYGDIVQPMALCEGFEIVTANRAFAQCLRLCPPLNGRMLIDHLAGLNNHEALFGPEGGTTTLHTRGKVFHLRGRRWPIQPHVTLLEVEDRTQLTQTAQALAHARTRDPQTGLLLTAPFQQAMERMLHAHQRAWLGMIRLPRMAMTSQGPQDWSSNEEHESRVDDLIAVSERLSHDLGERIVLGLGPCQRSIRIACPLRHAPPDGLEEEDEEARHNLRQLAQVSRRCLGERNPHRPAAVGLATYPAHGNNALELMQALGLAVEKAEEKSQPIIFNQDLAVQKERRIALSQDFAAALTQGAIAPHFQPVIHAQTGKLLSFEALIRWTHPKLGYVIPPHIISIARSRKMLAPLTYAVMEHCLAEMTRWPERISFAINVLPEQLTGELVDMVRETVRRARIDPGRLEIEITEDALIENFDRSQRIIARLRAIGVSVAMDDFGAGFTSLSNLTRLSVDKIKIDKSISDGLPHDPKACAIVRAILHLGSELGGAITVEGIEDEVQLAMLKPYDCGVQGFVHSRPLPPENLTAITRFLAAGEHIASN